MAELRDRDLVRLYWPAELRPAFDALFALDDAMADVVLQATQPALAAIKLAWWRERLENLDQGKVPAEPRLQAAAELLLPRGVTGAALAELEGGWAALLAEQVDGEAALARGTTLFALGAHLLGATSPELAEAGRMFAAGDLKRRGLMPAVEQPSGDLPSFPARLRPLTALAALARRDLRRAEGEATPARALSLLRHRMTGRF